MTPTYESLIVNTYIDIAAALELLGRSMSGKQHDPSWMRAKTLTTKEREIAAWDAYLILQRAEKELRPAADSANDSFRNTRARENSEEDNDG